MEVATLGPAEQVGGHGIYGGGGTRGAQTCLLLHPALGVGSIWGTAIHPRSQTWKPLSPPPGSPPRALAHPAHQSTLLSLVLVGSPGRGAKSHTGPVGPLRAVALGNPRAVLGPARSQQSEHHRGGGCWLGPELVTERGAQDTEKAALFPGPFAGLAQDPDPAGLGQHLSLGPSGGPRPLLN